MEMLHIAFVINLKCCVPKEIPVVFPNGSNYDQLAELNTNIVNAFWNMQPLKII